MPTVCKRTAGRGSASHMDTSGDMLRVEPRGPPGAGDAGGAMLAPALEQLDALATGMPRSRL